jgi:hypothetical protein
VANPSGSARSARRTRRKRSGCISACSLGWMLLSRSPSRKRTALSRAAGSISTSADASCWRPSRAGRLRAATRSFMPARTRRQPRKRVIVAGPSLFALCLQDRDAIFQQVVNLDCCFIEIYGLHTPGLNVKMAPQYRRSKLESFLLPALAAARSKNSPQALDNSTSSSTILESRR